MHFICTHVRELAPNLRNTVVWMARGENLQQISKMSGIGSVSG